MRRQAPKVYRRTSFVFSLGWVLMNPSIDTSECPIYRCGLLRCYCKCVYLLGCPLGRLGIVSDADIVRQLTAVLPIRTPLRLKEYTL